MGYYAMMDAIILGFGGYIVCQYILMKKDKKLRENMLLPKELDVKKCRDVQGYIAGVGMKQLVLGISVMICGMIGLIQDMTEWKSTLIYSLVIVFCLGCTVWYTKAMRQAVKEFWK